MSRRERERERNERIFSLGRVYRVLRRVSAVGIAR